MRTRFIILNICFVIITAVITVRFFALQVLSNDFYIELAENQHQLYRTLVPERGEIFVTDEQGDRVVIGTNIEKNLVFVVPPEVEEKQRTATILAPLLELDWEEVFRKVSSDNRQWVPLKKQLSEELSREIESLDLPGVYLQPETHRFYPEKSLAAQVLGFVGFEGDQRVGQYGIESYFENELAGSSGVFAAEKDAFGRWITSDVRNVEPARNGSDIVLTINRAIQFKVQEVLKKAVELHEADGGSVLVMDPKTGAVLAMADYPTFDPNQYSEVEDASVFRNKAVSDAYEPGSVFKPFTMVAALDEEVITPDMTYEDAGLVEIDGYTIRNSDKKAYGVQNMTQVLENSLNTGVIFVQDMLGPKPFLDAIQRFGFGKETGISLPFEAKGSIDNLRGGGDIHYATASFGQGITSTLLQLAQAYSAIANGGVLVQPYIVERLERPDGEVVVSEPVEHGQIVSSKAAHTVAAMMVAVVENGHGKQAGVPGYYVAGKTGTAQVVGQAGYDEEATIGTFAGFAPVDDPKFVMVVRIDNPKTVRFAESTAAPVFGEIAQFLLQYFHVPPSR